MGNESLNTFTIENISVKGNRIDYTYRIDGEWKKYFNPSENFFVEYNEDITGLSQSLAAVPLLSNVLPLAALFGAKISTPAIDKDFYESISEFMDGYYQMWRDKSEDFHFEFQDIVEASTIEKNTISHKEDAPSMLYFSGGVDAYASLIEHENENLIILTVGGADTYYTNKKGLDVILKKNQEIADRHQVKLLSLTSSFRKFIDEAAINEYLIPILEDNFWHAFQHSVGMFGLCVGYLYKYGIQKIYLASSYAVTYKIKIRTGSDPTIYNFVKIANMEVSHDLFEVGRQGKLHMLAKYHKQTGRPIKLRVCYRATDGENCCECEKCIRTIMGILAEREDPRMFGFDYDPDKIYLQFARVLKQLNREKGKEGLIQSRFEEIRHKMREIYPDVEKAPKELQLFLSADIEQLAYFLEIPEEDTARRDILGAQKIIKKAATGNQFFERYFLGHADEFSLLCRNVLEQAEERMAQKSEHWIGNHGLVLNSNATVEKREGSLIISSRGVVSYWKDGRQTFRKNSRWQRCS